MPVAVKGLNVHSWHFALNSPTVAGGELAAEFTTSGRNAPGVEITAFETWRKTQSRVAVEKAARMTGFTNPGGWRKLTASAGRLVIAIGIAVGLLVSLGTIGESGQIYAGARPYYNLQADALAHGRLGLSGNPREMAFDLAWSQGAVQQVWGLGVPAWIIALSHVTFEGDPIRFPSRLAFCVALILGVWGVLNQTASNTSARLGDDSSPWRYLIVFMPTVAILVCFPTFCALLKSCFRIYEEACAYGYLFAVLLSVLLVWFARRPTWPSLVLLFLAAGASPFVRPTVGIYGGSAVLVACCVAFRARIPLWKIVFCGLGYVTLTGFLLWTNYMRFGSPIEFGYRVNVSYHPDNVYSTKFESPYENERLIPAAKELLGGLLFEADFNEGRWFDKNVFRWQSETLRWRENYLPAVGWPMIGLGLVGIIAGGLALRHRKTGFVPLAILSVYSAVSLLGLAFFYLRCPVMSSRYLYDFSAGLAVAAAAAWLDLSARAVRKGWPSTLAAVITGFAICLYLCERAKTARCGEQDAPPLDRSGYEQLLDSIERHRTNVAALPREVNAVRIQANSYEGGLDIPFEGCGWSPYKGEVSVATIHFVRDIEFLELEVEPLVRAGMRSPDPTWIRAKVGLEYLVREGVEMRGDRLTIRFKAPTSRTWQKSIRVVFIGWVTKEHLADEKAPWVMHGIRWRD